MRARLLAAFAVCFLFGASTASAQHEVVQYYAVDTIGTVRVVFDQAGAITSRRDYEPFGAPLAPITSDPKIYAGLFHDDESGLQYAQARMYRAKTGRFTAPDPVYAGLYDPQQWNRYSYARGNPCTYVDSTGKHIESVTVVGRFIPVDIPVSVIPARASGTGGGGGASRGSSAGIGSRGRGGNPGSPENPSNPGPQNPGPETPTPEDPDNDNDCEKFVGEMTDNARAAGLKGLAGLGAGMQGRALVDWWTGEAYPSTTSGFQGQHIEPFQGRGVYRHIDFSAGAIIGGGGIVPFVGMDLWEATMGRTERRRGESLVELRNDIVGMKVGFEILRAAVAGDYGRMQQNLLEMLCK